MNSAIDFDRTSSTVREKIANRSRPMHIFILNGIEAVLLFLVVKVFGRFAYDKRYLKGRHFEKIWSPGWRWAFNGLFSKLFTGAGRGVPWPISSECRCGSNVDFDIDDLNNFQVSSYYQTVGDARIVIGAGTWIARGCALITSNHDPYCLDKHLAPEGIEIGERCWLGANVVLMPGVVLGPHTVVGANAVVTRSFADGHCVIGGVPAKKIKDLKKVKSNER